jgi:hypothetical protein
MRVLGIEIAGSNVQMILLKGTAKIFTIDILSPSKLPLPPDPEEVNRLLALKKQVYDLLKSNSVESIGIIRADPGSSPLRAKVECVIQLAAADASVPCKLVAAQTASAALKRKIGDLAGDACLQLVQQLAPAYLRKAALCAWCVHNDKQ